LLLLQKGGFFKLIVLHYSNIRLFLVELSQSLSGDLIWLAEKLSDALVGVIVFP